MLCVVHTSVSVFCVPAPPSLPEGRPPNFLPSIWGELFPTSGKKVVQLEK